MKSVRKWINDNIVDLGEEPSNTIDNSKYEDAKDSKIVESTSKTVLVSDLSKFKEFFQKSMKDMNLPGPDYFEFSQMYAELAQSLELKKAMEISFNSLKHTGLTKEILLSSAETYLNNFDNIKIDYQKVLDEKKIKEVDDKNHLIEENNKRIVEINQQLSELQTELSNIQNKNISLAGEISISDNQIKLNLSNYNSAHEEFVNSIKIDINNIKQNI